jgi:hypothetical protein
MNRTARRLAACVLLGLTAGCAGVGTRGDADGGRREIVVDAEGWAPISGSDTLDARRRALIEAQKKAVEKAVGVTLRARTRVDDAVNVKQSIVANMGGTIGRYEVTSESQEGGFFKVGIHAVVVYQPLAPERPEKTASKLAIRISSPGVEAAVRGALAASDFEFSEAGAPADVVVTGVVETKGVADPRLGGFYSYTAKVTLTAADSRSGRVTQTEYEAAAVDTDESAARQRSLESAGNTAGVQLATALQGGPARVASEENRDQPELARVRAVMAGMDPMSTVDGL